ncbi:unnamed protein product [Amoebophrya sp. A120]|nr:unnamed protein product [Amoebophrya sp. A120]|eukprot:GSA120T00014552001.1
MQDDTFPIGASFRRRSTSTTARAAATAQVREPAPQQHRMETTSRAGGSSTQRVVAGARHTTARTEASQLRPSDDVEMISMSEAGDQEHRQEFSTSHLLSSSGTSDSMMATAKKHARRMLRFDTQRQKTFDDNPFGGRIVENTVGGLFSVQAIRKVGPINGPQRFSLHKRKFQTKEETARREQFEEVQRREPNSFKAFEEHTTCCEMLCLSKRNGGGLAGVWNYKMEPTICGCTPPARSRTSGLDGTPTACVPETYETAESVARHCCLNPVHNCCFLTVFSPPCCGGTQSELLYGHSEGEGRLCSPTHLCFRPDENANYSAQVLQGLNRWRYRVGDDVGERRRPRPGRDERPQQGDSARGDGLREQVQGGVGAAATAAPAPDGAGEQTRHEGGGQDREDRQLHLTKEEIIVLAPVLTAFLDELKAIILYQLAARAVFSRFIGDSVPGCVEAASCGKYCAARSAGKNKSEQESLEKEKPKSGTPVENTNGQLPKKNCLRNINGGCCSKNDLHACTTDLANTCLFQTFLSRRNCSCYLVPCAVLHGGLGTLCDPAGCVTRCGVCMLKDCCAHGLFIDVLGPRLISKIGVRQQRMRDVLRKVMESFDSAAQHQVAPLPSGDGEGAARHSAPRGGQEHLVAPSRPSSSSSGPSTSTTDADPRSSSKPAYAALQWLLYPTLQDLQRYQARNGEIGRSVLLMRLKKCGRSSSWGVL